ncbi:MAG: TMEM175 family protein [Anaerolineae bacterium]
MSKQRLEAFSDGVIAIIITVMVLELRPPTATNLAALRPLAPVFFSYVLSFVNLGIYWNNHHHLFQAVEHVNGRVLWANLHLLFWLSLLPFATAWLGASSFATWPVALYGIDLLLAAVAYFLLVQALLPLHGSGSTLADALGSGLKERISLGLYVLAVALAFFIPPAAFALYVLVAAMWLVPDPRIERRMSM